MVQNRAFRIPNLGLKIENSAFATQNPKLANKSPTDVSIGLNAEYAEFNNGWCQSYHSFGSTPTIIGCTTIDLSTIDPSDDILLWTSIDAYDAVCTSFWILNILGRFTQRATHTYPSFTPTSFLFFSRIYFSKLFPVKI
uniref:Lectin_legB domain-containing protein n=1 Tax=Ascaris lumbricoides TaxID=6252 RepID=A0A0M3IV68_ASCLU